jgi:hypothetical protein
MSKRSMNSDNEQLDLIKPRSSYNNKNLKMKSFSRTIYGKPSVLVRNHPKFSTKKAEDDANLVELFKKTNMKKNAEITKYFDRLKKEEEDINEYNRT